MTEQSTTSCEAQVFRAPWHETALAQRAGPREMNSPTLCQRWWTQVAEVAEVVVEVPEEDLWIATSSFLYLADHGWRSAFVLMRSLREKK